MLIPALPLTCWVSLGKSCPPSVPQFPLPASGCQVYLMRARPLAPHCSPNLSSALTWEVFTQNFDGGSSFGISDLLIPLLQRVSLERGAWARARQGTVDKHHARPDGLAGAHWPKP